MTNADKNTMNADIKEFGVYVVYPSGRIVKIDEIQSVKDYDHYNYQIHHYIKSTKYHQDKNWYKERNIEQKLFLIPTIMHQHLENPIYQLSDEDFLKKYKVSRQKLLFSKKWSKY